MVSLISISPDGTAVLIGFSEPTFTGVEGGMVQQVQISTQVPTGMDPDLLPSVVVQYSTRSDTALDGKIWWILQQVLWVLTAQ